MIIHNIIHLAKGDFPSPAPALCHVYLSSDWINSLSYILVEVSFGMKL